MSKGIKSFLVVAVIVVLGAWGFSSLRGAYNELTVYDKNINGAWSQLKSVFEKRANLALSLVETIETHAEQKNDADALKAVTQARHNATQQHLSHAGVLKDPELFRTFEQTQDQLSGALGRLSVSNSELTSDQGLAHLQDELSAIEHRIKVEKRRFNQIVQDYNKEVASFPALIFARMFGFQPHPYFEPSQSPREKPENALSTEID